jgi:hypothetical protein
MIDKSSLGVILLAVGIVSLAVTIWLFMGKDDD